MFRRFSILFLITMAFIIQAQNAPRNNNPAFPDAVPTNKDVHLLTFGKEIYKVKYIPNVVYSTHGDTTLTLQLFVPMSDKQEKFPCIIFIKGSAWMKQDIYGNIPQISQFARRGYVLAEVQYRPTPGAVFPAQRNDAIDAYKYMKARAKDYNIDTTNMFMWGDSSGAHTALFTGISLNGDIIPRINGIIAFYPPSNLLTMKNDPTAATTGDQKSPEGLLMGGVSVANDTLKAKAISPYYYINSNTPLPPILLAHGTKDRVVPFSQSDNLANLLQKSGKQFIFYALKGADHGSWQFWTPEMFDKVELFIKRYTVK